MQNLSNSTLFWSSSSTDTKVSIIVFYFDNPSLGSRYSLLKLIRVFGRIGASLKYFKRTICFFLFMTYKMRCTRQGYILNTQFTPNNPYLGGGIETFNHIKNVYYPNDMCQMGFEISESTKSLKGGYMGHPVYSIYAYRDRKNVITPL